MDPAIIGAVATAIAAILGGVGSLFVASRRLSGKVQTTEAKDLWAASTRLQEALEKRNEFLAKRVDSCSDQLEELYTKVNELEKDRSKLFLDNARLKDVTQAHEDTISILQNQLVNMSKENEILRNQNASLRKRVLELERTSHG